MPLPPRLLRYTRKAAHSLGLLDPSCAPLARSLALLIDRRAPELIAAHRVPGLSLHVSLADGTPIERCYGVADTSTGARMAPAHVFQVMSISKPVTAFGVMRLAAKGLLDLDAPVSTYLRSWTLPRDRRHTHDFDHVTLRRILSHSAGLNVHGFLWSTPDAPTPSTAQLLDGVEGPDFLLRLIHPPGERLHYSGGGYTLIQLIIEDVTGRPFADVMRDEVLAPLGMTSSSYIENDDIRAHLATRHDAQGAPLPRALCAAHAPTGLYSTPRDLTKLWTAMYRGPAGEPPGRGVLPPELAKQMTTPHTDPAATRVCGLGFFLWLKRSDTVFSHAGFKHGWWSQVDGLLSRRCTIAVCSNGESGAECAKALCAEIRQYLFDHAM
jgi:CubicO group peptidase (beta-lactamase class C family)